MGENGYQNKKEGTEDYQQESNSYIKYDYNNYSNYYRKNNNIYNTKQQEKNEKNEKNENGKLNQTVCLFGDSLYRMTMVNLLDIEKSIDSSTYFTTKTLVYKNFKFVLINNLWEDFEPYVRNTTCRIIYILYGAHFETRNGLCSSYDYNNLTSESHLYFDSITLLRQRIDKYTNTSNKYVLELQNYHTEIAAEKKGICYQLQRAILLNQSEYDLSNFFSIQSEKMIDYSCDGHHFLARYNDTFMGFCQNKRAASEEFKIARDQYLEDFIDYYNNTNYYNIKDHDET